MSMTAWDDVNKRFIKVQADEDGILKTKPEGVYLEEAPTLVDGEQHRLTLTVDGKLRVDVEAGEAFYSETNDLSDVTRTAVAANSVVAGVRETLFTSAVAVFLLCGYIQVERPVVEVEVTVDGGATQTLIPILQTDSTGGADAYHCLLPPIRCDASLLIQVFNNSASARDWGGECWTK